MYKLVVYSKNQTIPKGNVHERGLVNTLINAVPIELDLPGNHFCGAETKLKKRLQRVIEE